MRLRGTGHRAAVGVMVATCAIACSGTRSVPGPPSPAASSPAAAEPLQLDFSFPAERWRTVATFPLTGGERPPSAFPGIKGCARASATPQLHWSVAAATLDIELVPSWHRRYALATNHLVAIQVRSAQIAHGHVYLWLGVVGAPTNAPGGALLLELDSAGNVASLERVAVPSGADPQIKRLFCIAPDGTAYQWFTTPTHAELRVRP